MRRHSLIAIAALSVVVMNVSGAARADEVGNAINEAGRAYQTGNTAATRALLEEALQFLTQRATSKLGAALPAPLPGWQAYDRQPRVAANVSVGGGNQVIRRYKNAQNQSVEIRVTVDSPVLNQISLVMANPAPNDAIGKAIQIKGQNAYRTSNDEIQMLVDGHVLVTVTGTAAIEDKMVYAEAIDFAQYTGWR